MRQPINAMQQQVYEYVWLFREQHGFSPTIREIQAYFRFSSPNAAQHYVNRLRAAGWLQSEPSSPRTLRPTPANEA